MPELEVLGRLLFRRLRFWLQLRLRLLTTHCRPCRNYDANQTNQTDQPVKVPFVTFVTVEVVDPEMLNYAQYYGDNDQYAANDLTRHFLVQGFSSSLVCVLINRILACQIDYLTPSMSLNLFLGKAWKTPEYLVRGLEHAAPKSGRGQNR